MGRKPDCRSTNNLRTLLAQEAARLICEHGFEDYGAAKHKASGNLGLTYRGALPNNREIEQAVAERNRIFSAQHHQTLLQQLRQAAIDVMYYLQPFKPRLVGSVLNGNITEHSKVSLHLFSDSAEAVGVRLSDCGIHHTAVSRRLRLQRDAAGLFPSYRFYSANCAIEAIVFSEQQLQHAPLSPIDGRPMKRAKLRELEQLTAI